MVSRIVVVDHIATIADRVVASCIAVEVIHKVADHIVNLGSLVAVEGYTNQVAIVGDSLLVWVVPSK